MKSLRDLSPQLALAGFVAFQLSCGDSSGPGASAASIEAVSSTTIGAAPGAQVAELPSVIVKDGNGNPVSGVPVTFTVTGGGGSVTGNHPTSDASGIATVGSWTLGTTAGTNTLVATANNHSVTFTANGADPCVTLQNHAVGSTTNGQLSASDCQFDDGSLVDFYQVTIPTAGTYIFTQTSGVFDSFLLLFMANGAIAGVNDDANGSTFDSQLTALLPAGSFVVGANSFEPNKTGAYNLTSAATTNHITNCENVFVLRGVTSAQSLQSTDCAIGGIFGDQYFIYVQANQALTVSMSSTAVDSYLEIHLPNSTAILASNDDVDGTTKDARLVYTAPQTGFYVIAARTTVAGAVGAYTFSVE